MSGMPSRFLMNTNNNDKQRYFDRNIILKRRKIVEDKNAPHY